MIKLEKCPKCKHEYAKKPLKDQYGKWIWKNILIPDMQVIISGVIILLLLFAYHNETKACEEVVVDPCGFCERSNCCEYKSDNQKWDFDVIEKINDGSYS